MSNLKVLSWLAFFNTGQGCFQIPQYSLFCERVSKVYMGWLLCILANTELTQLSYGYLNVCMWHH
jgi:hypothetical protein